MNENPDIPNINKVTAEDMNEIKNVVNLEYDEIEKIKNTIKYIKNIQYGVAYIDVVANEISSVTVEFPQEFKTVPRVVVTPISTAPGTVLKGFSVTGVTTTGFTMYLYRTNSVNTGMYWIAVTDLPSLEDI